jgi:hypothetical protein
MGFAGHMQIELIQPLDDHPSVYRETIEARGHGFHHFGIACADVDADCRAISNAAIAWPSAPPCPPGAVAYLEGGTRPRRVSRADPGHARHGRAFHAVLESLFGLGWRRSGAPVPVRMPGMNLRADPDGLRANARGGRAA